MRKKLKLTIFLLLLLNSFVLSSASAFGRNDAVAVMDFGTRPGATVAEINIQNAEYTTSEYIIAALINNKFQVQDKDIVMNHLKEKGLKTTGLIDPDAAKEIGKLLGVRYIIYGNVVNVSVSSNGTKVLIVGGVDVCSVKAHVAARIMDVETGDIIALIKGDGQSKSSFTQIGSPLHGIIVNIGTKKVTMDSVHNAIRKAGEQIVTKLGEIKK